MELRQFRYFVVLAQEGNYLNAAEELFISQSQLSKKIMSLEAELGVKLIDRSRKKIAVTEEGRIVLDHARAILDSHAALVRELAAFEGLPPPILTILSIPVLAPYKIPDLLARFHGAEPDITIRLNEAEANEILPALVRGDAEIGFVREPFVDVRQFRFAPFCEDEVIVIVPASHRLAHRSGIDLSELRSERFILLDKPTLLHDFFLDLCRRRGVEPIVVHTSTHSENIVEMVASGMGVSLMMRRVVEHIENDKIRSIFLEVPVDSQLGFAWPRDARLTKGAESFIAFARKQGIA
jgi:LysR family transcriptional regulator, transcription activator of glutamate synthase operon